MNTGVGPMNSSSLHQSNMIIISFIKLFKKFFCDFTNSDF